MIRIFLYRIIGLFIGVVALSLSSCFDEATQKVNYAGTDPIVELLDAKAHANNLTEVDVLYRDIPDTVSVRVHIAGKNPVLQDTKVNLRIDPSIYENYIANQYHEGHLELLTSDKFSISDLFVTIKKGSYARVLPIIIYTNRFHFDRTYLFPLYIVSSEPKLTVSANYSKILYQFNLKNKYEGVYKSKGYRYDYQSAYYYKGWDFYNNVPSGSAQYIHTWDWDEVDCKTRVDENTINLHVGNSRNQWGFFNITVMPDNSVKITATDETFVPNLKILDEVPSSYDPEKREFTLYYQYTNSSGTYRVLHDRITYIKSNEE